MIPARLGSQRLKQKNLQLFNGKPLIENAIEKAKEVDFFDEIWVNSESEQFGEIAQKQEVNFHKRPKELAGNTATSEDFIYEFLTHHECDYIVQLHSIAPLITIDEIYFFVQQIVNIEAEIHLAVEAIQIECFYENQPVNFDLTTKTNSQDLIPVERISWAITAWKANTFLQNYREGNCATYGGKINKIHLSSEANLVVKTINDLKLARSIYNVKNS